MAVSREVASYQGQQEIVEAINGFTLSGVAQKAVWFDSVSSMQRADIPAGATAATRGYHTVNDGGNAFYYIREKTQSDVEDGGSIIFLDNENVAELIFDGEVNINQFGGKGDGVTDDNTAIVNAVAFASAKNCRLVFLQGYTYYSSQGIVIEAPPKEIRMDGELYYTGNGTALTIGKAGVGVGGLILKLYVSGSPSHTAGSNGVVLYNVGGSQIDIYHVRYFGDTAVTFNGDAGGVGYNTVFVREIYSSPILLKLTSSNGGWVNENIFLGGRYGVQGADSFKNTVIGILINGSNKQNNNIFYSPNLELANGIKIESGMSNLFLNCRSEGSANPFEVTAGNNTNYMSTYACNEHYDGYGNMVQDITKGYRVVDLCKVCVFDSGHLALKYAGNASKSSVAEAICLYYGALKHMVANNQLSVADDMVYSAGVQLGVVVDTSVNKLFSYRVIGSGKLRPYVYMWDADGQPIADAEDKPIYSFSIALGYQSATGGYIMGSDTTLTQGNEKQWFISIPSACKKAFIGIGAIGSCGISRFSINAPVLCSRTDLQNYKFPVLDSIPTSAGYKGQFVGKETPTAGEVGWVYDGTNWIAVG